MTVCVVCGCTDLEACVDVQTAERCQWIAPGDADGFSVCSFCADPDRGGILCLGMRPYEGPRIPLEGIYAEVYL